MGTSFEIAHFSDLIVSLHWEGSPGPLLQKRPSHFRLALRVDHDSPRRGATSTVDATGVSDGRPPRHAVDGVAK